MTERGKTRALFVSLLCNGLLVGFLLGQLRGEAFQRSALRQAQELTTVPTPIDTVVAAAIVRRDPLDLDRLDAALARVRAGDEALLTSVHSALRSAAAKLDPKSRDVIADVLANAPPAGGRFDQRYRWTYLRRVLD